MELKLKPLILALAGFTTASLSHAAALDRSTQPSWAFTQDGTFAYVEEINICPKVKGKDISGNNVPNLTKDHHFLNYGAKADVNDRVSLGIFIDQPWGADVEYKGNNIFITPATATTPAQSTKVEVSSRTFTGMVGVKMGEKKNFQVYGGPVLEQATADVEVRGSFFPLPAYDVKINRASDVGWMAGVAYSKPEIALKAALTYRSPIEHNVKVAESIPLLNVNQTAGMILTTPKSVNLDFQTGIATNTLLTAKLRWVPWSDFAIQPPYLKMLSQKIYGQAVPLINYDKDSWTAELGLGRKINDKWAVSGAVGWDSGAGDPVNTLGPVKGNKNIGLGVKYNLTPEWALSGGVKYLKFGDAKGNLPHPTNLSANDTVRGNFTDNDGWVYGLRLSYQKK